jgi:hypothetical protein
VQSLTTPRPTTGAGATSSRNARNSNNNTAEVEMQYKAQVDVIGQLEEKLLRQLQHQKTASSDKTKTTLIKLSKDFERVQARAVQLQGSVSRWHKQQAASAAAQAQDSESSGVAAAASESQQDYYEQMQLQLEEDVSVIYIIECDVISIAVLFLPRVCHSLCFVLTNYLLLVAFITALPPHVITILFYILSTQS